MIRVSTEMPAEIADYVLEDYSKYTALYPYLYPKLKGDWFIVLVSIGIKDVRELLNTTIHSYLEIVVVESADVVENLHNEFPNIVELQKSTWDFYLECIATLPVTMDKGTVSALYKGIPHSRSVIKHTLDVLVDRCSEAGIVKMSDVKLVTSETQACYANQVVKSLFTNYKRFWRDFNRFEQDLGPEYAFYTLRKYVAKLVAEKSKYLQNHEYKDKNVELIDVYSIIYLHQRLQEAKSPKQLMCILSETVRREEKKV